MKNLSLIILFLFVCTAAKSQSSFTIVNNTVGSLCSIKVYISYYDRSCNLLTKSNAVVIPNGASATLNISSLSWSSGAPNALWIPSFTVYYPNANGIPCSKEVTVSGPCYSSTGQLGICHPSCATANITYDASTATLTVAY